MLTFKIIVSIILFVWTGGAVASEWKKHKILAYAAGCVAILSGYYLFATIYHEFFAQPGVGVEHQARAVNVDAEIQGAPVETEVIAIGQKWRGWTYNKTDANYASFIPPNKQYDRLIRFPAANTPQIKIFSQKASNWIAVIGLDLDGKESIHYINQSTGKVLYSRNDAKDVFWSPSGRYIVTLCGGEVDYFALLDTKTGQYFTGNAIEDKRGSYYVRSDLSWPKNEAFFVATIEQWSIDRMDILKTIRAIFSIPKLAWKPE